MTGELTGIVVGACGLLIAAIGVIRHHLGERRRAELLRNLDHHEWYCSSRTRPRR